MVQDKLDFTLTREDVFSLLRDLFGETVEAARVRISGERKKVFRNIAARTLTLPMQSALIWPQ
ncbi:hypothetical protein OS493_002006 [Desmophyllum pertusum]|uniref:Uncharacterized protein n=1 Tax=Desmophyllum pertusum TaxID=174260 RepID=A0A9W9Z6D5_9CNID|nr:hypothetical protein OS493_002006 [Desmophyllum pertusum]